jgi:hypothetical protein
MPGNKIQLYQEWEQIFFNLTYDQPLKSIGMKYILALVLLFAGTRQSSAQKLNQPADPKSRSKTTAVKVLQLVSEHQGPVISTDHPGVLASGNRSGFETGQVVKLENVYHMFVNEMFDRPHRELRIAYWTSSDAINWVRQKTVIESIPGRTATNPRSEVWVNAVVFNEEENAWNLFYVAYRAGDSTRGEIQANDYEGKVWRARSVIQGTGGIAGPYADMGIVLQPDSTSQSWEGQQAVASFFPYKAGRSWFAIYDGHFHTPRGPWPDGMAFAQKLNGPWTRMPEGFNPLTIVPEFAENAIVSRLRDGRYLMVFDSFGDQEIGYSLSRDGVHWDPEIRVKIQSAGKLWALAGDHYTRTPLCAIEENDGTFTVVYTALTKVNDRNFYAVGKCSLAWK